MSILFYMYECLHHNGLSAPRACPWRPEEGILFPGTGIMDSYKPACGARSSSSLLQEKQVLVTAKPSFQPWLCFFLFEV